jgi:hypothetical protein
MGLKMGKSDTEYTVGLNTKKFDKEQGKLDNQFRKMKISADNFGKSTGMSLLTMTVGAGGAVLAFKALGDVIGQVSEGITKYNTQAKAEATLDQTLKSTGYAAGLTAVEIKNLSSELQSMTVYGDEAILASSNLLLTFKQVGEETFPRAQKAILDVSAAMGQDLKSSSIQVGKALNDPIAGMTAMSRVGITFTDTQKELVKGFVETNDLASAQAVILTELESQFGGVAEAQAKLFDGTVKQVGNLYGDIQEKTGKGFTEEMTKPLQDLLASLTAASPELMSLAESFGSIAGALISVPTNALTGWIDLFAAYSAGSTASISNPILKAQSQAQDDLTETLKNALKSVGGGDIGTQLQNREVTKNFGGRSAIQELFLNAEKGNLGALRTISTNDRLNEIYNLSIKRVKALNDAFATTQKAIEDNSLNGGGIVGDSNAPGLGGSTKAEKVFDAEKELDLIAANRLQANTQYASTGIDIDAYEKEQMAILDQEDRDIANQILEQAREDQKIAQEQALNDRIAFYDNTTSIIENSETAIMSIHQVWASNMLSIQAQGMADLTSATSNILQSIGGLTGNSSLLSGSGLIGGLSIAGAAFGLLGGVASLFEDDDNSSASDYSTDSTANSTTTANIVSSAPDIKITSNFTLNTNYADAEGVNQFFTEEMLPRMKEQLAGTI